MLFHKIKNCPFGKNQNRSSHTIYQDSYYLFHFILEADTLPPGFLAPYLLPTPPAGQAENWETVLPQTSPELQLLVGLTGNTETSQETEKNMFSLSLNRVFLAIPSWEIFQISDFLSLLGMDIFFLNTKIFAAISTQQFMLQWLSPWEGKQCSPVVCKCCRWYCGMGWAAPLFALLFWYLTVVCNSPVPSSLHINLKIVPQKCWRKESYPQIYTLTYFCMKTCHGICLLPICIMWENYTGSIVIWHARNG